MDESLATREMLECKFRATVVYVKLTTTNKNV